MAFAVVSGIFIFRASRAGCAVVGWAVDGGLLPLLKVLSTMETPIRDAFLGW